MRSATVDGLKKGDRVRINGPVEVEVLGVKKVSAKSKEANLTPQAKADGVEQHSLEVRISALNNSGDQFTLLEDGD